MALHAGPGTTQTCAEGEGVALTPLPGPCFQGVRPHMKSELAVCSFASSPDAYFGSSPLCPLSISLLFAFCERA